MMYVKGLCVLLCAAVYVCFAVRELSMLCHRTCLDKSHWGLIFCKTLSALRKNVLGAAESQVMQRGRFINVAEDDGFNI